MNSVYLLGSRDCSIQDIKRYCMRDLTLEVELDLKLKLQQQRIKLESILQESDRAIYGINTDLALFAIPSFQTINSVIW